MTPRERAYAFTRRQPLDALPWQFDLTGAAPAETSAENIAAIVEVVHAQQQVRPRKVTHGTIQ
jgi:hypothetical protein